MRRAKDIDTRPVWKEPPAYDPLPILLVYVLVIIGSAFAALDFYLPLSRTSSVITQVKEYSSRAGSRGQGHTMMYWSSLQLANDKDIWTQRTANNFATGDSMDVEVSAVLGKVIRYRGYRPGHNRWYSTEGAQTKYRPFPFAAMLFAALLLYTGWSSESRMLLRGILIVVTVAWVLTAVVTGG